MTVRDEGEWMESLVGPATELVDAVRDYGPDEIARVMKKLSHADWYRLCIVLAAMVHPDAGIRQLLGWTRDMTPELARGRVGRSYDPPAERERQRLLASGIQPDTAILLAAAHVQDEHIDELPEFREPRTA